MLKINLLDVEGTGSSCACCETAADDVCSTSARFAGVGWFLGDITFETKGDSKIPNSISTKSSKSEMWTSPCCSAGTSMGACGPVLSGYLMVTFSRGSEKLEYVKYFTVFVNYKQTLLLLYKHCCSLHQFYWKQQICGRNVKQPVILKMNM